MPDADDKTKIDCARLSHMVDASLDAGHTYFDTACPYHGGWSERVVGECLARRYDRESLLLADKMPAWSLKWPGDVERILAGRKHRLRHEPSSASAHTRPARKGRRGVRR